MRSNNEYSNNPKIEYSPVKEIDLKNIFNVIKRRFWIVILITVITTTVGYYYDANHKPTTLYEYTTRMILSANQQSIGTLKVLIKDPTVLEKVIEELKLTISPEKLASQIEVKEVGGEVISISAVDSNKDLAVKIADTTATVFKREIVNIMDFHGVNILTTENVYTKVIINGEASNTKIAAIIVGVVGGIGLILLLNALDNSLINEQDIQQSLGIPVLGSVSKINKRNQNKKKVKQQQQQILNVRGETIDS